MGKRKTFKQFWKEHKKQIQFSRSHIPRKQRRKEAYYLWKLLHKRNVHYQQE